METSEPWCKPCRDGYCSLGRAWQLLLKGHAELGQAPDPAAAYEMLIIRLAHVAQMPTPAECKKYPKRQTHH